MDCQEFLARYSEYIDEVMNLADAGQMQQHLDTCARCLRYDRVMRRGLDLARAMPAIGPSSDFQARLEHRLLHVRDEVGADGRMLNGGAAVSLALAGLLALAAWGPLLSRDAGVPLGARAEQGDAPPAQYTVYREPAAPTPASDGWWHVAATTESAWMPTFSPVSNTLTGALPGPYSPLVVMPPAVHFDGRSGGAIPMAYPGID